MHLPVPLDTPKVFYIFREEGEGLIGESFNKTEFNAWQARRHDRSIGWTVCSYLIVVCRLCLS